MKERTVKWFLASEKKTPGELHLFVVRGKTVRVGEGVPKGAVMAHLKTLPEGTWVVRRKFTFYPESIEALLNALQVLDGGFEPEDSHAFESRPGFLAVIDLIVMAASKR